MANDGPLGALAAMLVATATSASAADGLINAVTFACAGGKTIAADFYPSRVDLKLSDGRSLSLPQAMSGSGARYADKDEKLVFWTKGEGAFITEGGASGPQTFADCVVKPKG